MKEQAGKQEERMEKLVQELTESEGFDAKTIGAGEETAEKASKMMEIYLGEDPDTQEAFRVLMFSRRCRGCSLQYPSVQYGLAPVFICPQFSGELTTGTELCKHLC